MSDNLYPDFSEEEREVAGLSRNERARALVAILAGIVVGLAFIALVT